MFVLKFVLSKSPRFDQKIVSFVIGSREVERRQFTESLLPVHVILVSRHPEL